MLLLELRACFLAHDGVRLPGILTCGAIRHCDGTGCAHQYLARQVAQSFDASHQLCCLEQVTLILGTLLECIGSLLHDLGSG